LRLIDKKMLTLQKKFRNFAMLNSKEFVLTVENSNLSKIIHNVSSKRGLAREDIS